MIHTTLIRYRPALLALFCLAWCTQPAHAQKNEYETAIARFTGEHKWDIEKPGTLVGIEAPDFEGIALDGTPIKLSAFRAKKVVVLNFWFIACVPCRMEIAPLNEIVGKFKDKDVVFISVAREKYADLRKHLKTAPFVFRTIADSTLQISRDTYHLFGYPTTIVIDKTGKIRYYTLGGKISEDAVRKEMEQKLVPVINSCLTQ